MATKNLIVEITAEEHQKLKMLAAKSNMSMSDLVRPKIKELIV